MKKYVLIIAKQIEKKKELNKKYPRQGGKPKKNPL